MPSGGLRNGCEELVTDRLRLRLLRAGDAGFLCRLAEDAPEMAAVLPDMTGPCDETRAARWIAHRSRAGTCGLAVLHGTFPTLLGIAGWGGSSHIPRLFLWLGAAYRGQGFGLEILTALLRHLESRDASHAEMLCAPGDVAARAFLERVGFTAIGEGPGGAPGAVACHYLYDFPPWTDRV